MIGVAVGALVLLLALGGFLVYRNDQRAKAERRAEEARIAAEARARETIQSVVRDYYAALGTGDVDRLVTLAEGGPPDRAELLAREVLVEAAKKAPIKDVVTTPPTSTAGLATVPVSYTIGDRPVTTKHELVQQGDSWKLKETTASVSLGSGGPNRKVNGKEVPAGRYRLYPGGYSVTSTSPLFEVADGELVVADLSAQAPTPPRVEVSQAGKQASIDAGRRWLNDCLGRKELAPAGCPIRFVFNDGTVPDLSTLRYTLKNDPWATATPLCSGTSCRMPVSISIEVGGSGTKQGSPATLYGTGNAAVTVRVDLAENPPAVTFSRI